MLKASHDVKALLVEAKHQNVSLRNGSSNKSESFHRLLPTLHDYLLAYDLNNILNLN